MEGYVDKFTEECCFHRGNGRIFIDKEATLVS